MTHFFDEISKMFSHSYGFFKVKEVVLEIGFLLLNKTVARQNIELFGPKLEMLGTVHLRKRVGQFSRILTCFKLRKTP